MEYKIGDTVRYKPDGSLMTVSYVNSDAKTIFYIWLDDATLKKGRFAIENASMWDTMPAKRGDERRKLVALADALFDELMMVVSNDGIINEVIENGDDVSAIHDYMRARFEDIENFISGHVQARFEEIFMEVKMEFSATFGARIEA